MSAAPVVTVIVPGFDVAEYVPEALDSLRAQTLANWRAVLVDDGSADATGALFDEAAASDARFTSVHHEARRGLGAARNSGLDLVDTTFTAFLDADDVFTPAALETLVSVVAESGSDFAAGAYVRLRPSDTGYRAGAVQPWVARATAPARRAVTLAQHPAASGNIVAWSKVSRTDFWRRAGLRFPEGLYEDQLVAQRMYTLARSFDVVPDVVVHWRERANGSSITQQKRDIAVLRDYLGALRAGLGVLEASGHAAAASERVRLILDMDLPPLVDLAASHADAAYRRSLGDFARELWARGPAARANLSPEGSRSASVALLW